MEAYIKMRVEYTRLFKKLKENGITQKQFKTATKLSSGVINKLLHNENITIETICRICDYFQCMPDEIMEFIPDMDYAQKQEQKANIKKQIVELENQLKQI